VTKPSGCSDGSRRGEVNGSTVRRSYALRGSGRAAPACIAMPWRRPGGMTDCGVIVFIWPWRHATAAVGMHSRNSADHGGAATSSFAQSHCRPCKLIWGEVIMDDRLCGKHDCRRCSHIFICNTFTTVPPTSRQRPNTTTVQNTKQTAASTLQHGSPQTPHSTSTTLFRQRRDLLLDDTLPSFPGVVVSNIFL
jgi:hypothetical protein